MFMNIYVYETRTSESNLLLGIIIFNTIIPIIFNIIFSGFGTFVLPCHKYALELLNFFFTSSTFPFFRRYYFLFKNAVLAADWQDVKFFISLRSTSVFFPLMASSMPIALQLWRMDRTCLKATLLSTLLYLAPLFFNSTFELSLQKALVCFQLYPQVLICRVSGTQ